MEKVLLESHKQCSQIAQDRQQAVKNMAVVEQVQVYQGCVSVFVLFCFFCFVFPIQNGKSKN